jgi:hypothetical protein
MCILIENAEEVAYRAANGQWTREPGGGSCFASTRAAFAAAKREPLGRFMHKRIPGRHAFRPSANGQAKDQKGRPERRKMRGRLPPVDWSDGEDE